MESMNKFKAKAMQETERMIVASIAKIHSEYVEVLSAVIHDEGKMRIAEELADIQEACETAMAILGLTDEERRNVRKKVLCKNASRGYYNE